MKTESREDQLTLKTARLHMLFAAAESLAERQYVQCRDCLLTFLDTIPADLVAKKELYDAYKEFETVFNKGASIAETNVSNTRHGYSLNRDSDPMRGLPASDYQRSELNRLHRDFARSFHTVCWAVANEYSLIPLK